MSFSTAATRRQYYNNVYFRSQKCLLIAKDTCLRRDYIFAMHFPTHKVQFQTQRSRDFGEKGRKLIISLKPSIRKDFFA